MNFIKKNQKKIIKININLDDLQKEASILTKELKEYSDLCSSDFSLEIEVICNENVKTESLWIILSFIKHLKEVQKFYIEFKASSILHDFFLDNHLAQYMDSLIKIEA
jgi:predicted transport protein